MTKKLVFQSEVKSPLHGDFIRGDEVPESADPSWVGEMLAAGYVTETTKTGAAEMRAEAANDAARVAEAQAATAVPVAGVKRTTAPARPKKTKK